MRPTIDLAYRARNWFWYWRVRAISGLSNERLDVKAFGNEGRRRHFERIQASASAPDEMALVDGVNLLSIVEGWDKPEDGTPGPFAGATEDFHSVLWDFLAKRDQEPAVFSDYIQAFAQKRGWMRVVGADRSLFATFLGCDEPAIEPGISMAYSAMLHQFANEATPDAIAALIALFREAMSRVQLEQAMAIRLALRCGIRTMCADLEIAEDASQLIWQLAMDRILADRWITQRDWRLATGTLDTSGQTSRERVRDFQAWVSWYTQRPADFEQADLGQLPLVPRSARTDWVEANHDRLMWLLLEAWRLRHQGWIWMDSIDPERRRAAKESLDKADLLLATVSPPASAPARFYQSRPRIEISQLPRAYPVAPAPETAQTITKKDDL